jgi:hypothetical protein
MLSYKAWLQEKNTIGDVSWVQPVYTYIWATDGIIPLDTFLSKLIGNVRVQTYHVSDIAFLNKLIKLQGKKKSISSATKLDLSTLKYQMPITGDIEKWQKSGADAVMDFIAKIDGVVNFGSSADISSRPDDSGRRWVSLISVLQNYVYDYQYDKADTSKAIIDEIDKMKDKLSLKYVNKYKKMKIDFDMPDIYAGLIEQAKFSKGKDFRFTFMAKLLSAVQWSKVIPNWPKSHKKDVHDVIKAYIDGVHKIMKKYKDELSNMAAKALMQQGDGAAYNEIVVSQIKIKEILWIHGPAHTQAMTDKMAKGIKQTVGYKMATGRVDTTKVAKFMGS